MFCFIDKNLWTIFVITCLVSETKKSEYPTWIFKNAKWSKRGKILFKQQLADMSNVKIRINTLLT